MPNNLRREMRENDRYNVIYTIYNKKKQSLGQNKLGRASQRTTSHPI